MRCPNEVSPGAGEHLRDIHGNANLRKVILDDLQQAKIPGAIRHAVGNEWGLDTGSGQKCLCRGHIISIRILYILRPISVGQSPSL